MISNEIANCAMENNKAAYDDKAFTFGINDVINGSARSTQPAQMTFIFLRFDARRDHRDTVTGNNRRRGCARS